MFFGRKLASLPDQHRALFMSRLPQWPLLTPGLRPRFEARVMEFLGSKKFYGCDGLIVTEDMRVLIAASACLLILREDARVYPSLRSVLLYPTAFWVRHEEPDEDGLVYEDEVLQLGESQEWGRVILSWEDCEAALNGDEVNVPAHEFAHQLNEESPHEGAPLLADYTRWSSVMGTAYEQLRQHGSAVLDDYGTEGPGEFFAVATESYFQRGAELRRHHRELYELLRDFYLLDTAG
ncbi:MAG TPA: M90 family metallopeptidase [Verrucomicrobiae bacterium]|nr:M90 family metallopeptidase [Verrucomicrobiae bacterium]